MAYLRNFIIVTYENKEEPSNKKVRAHPLPDQGVSTSLNVECSAAMRESHLLGTLFKVECKVINREGTDILYRHYAWPYEVVTLQDATKFIKNEFGTRNSKI